MNYTFYAVFWPYVLILVCGGSYSIYYYRRVGREVAAEQFRERAAAEQAGRVQVTEVPQDDLVSVLGLSPTADDVTIRRRYRDLCKQWHPDQFSGSQEAERAEAERRIRQLNAAYERIMRARGADATV